MPAADFDQLPNFQAFHGLQTNEVLSVDSSLPRLIESLRLENFRGFEDHRVPLRDQTIIVGANNAGKSTVVEALRLVSVATDRLLRRTSRLVKTPDWLQLPVGHVGLSPAVRGLTSDGLEQSMFHQYGEPPAIVTATFSGGSKIAIYIGPGAQVHAIAHRPDGTPITNAGAAASLSLSPLAVQPQVAPLLREEPIRTEETIRRGDGTYLASQHFRISSGALNGSTEIFVGLPKKPGQDCRSPNSRVMPIALMSRSNFGCVTAVLWVRSA